MPRPGDVVADRYRIDGYLGRGGMSAVLSAAHEVTGVRYAIKWLLPRSEDDRGAGRERLLREARLVGRIDHPNVVRVHDVGEHEGSIFLVMELLRGESLKALTARGPFEPEEAVRILMPVMRAVAAAHEVGVVHRDLKPENVALAAVDEGGTVRPTVLDFGISRGSAPLPGDLTLTQTGVMVGTPLYMAPEQLAGTQDVDPRIDIYALGVMLYELLAGSRPFDEETYALLVSHKLNRAPKPLRSVRPDIDPRLERAVLRAISRRPSGRWNSVRDLATALEPFGGGCRFVDNDPNYRAGVLTGLPPPDAPPARWNARTATLAVGLVGLLLLGFLLVTRLSPPMTASPITEPEAPASETVAAPSIAPVAPAAQPEVVHAADSPLESEPTPDSRRTPAGRHSRTGTGRGSRTGPLRVSEF